MLASQKGVFTPPSVAHLPDGTHWQVVATPRSNIFINRVKGDFGEWVRFSNLHTGHFKVEYLCGGISSIDNPHQDLDPRIAIDNQIIENEELSVEMAKKVIEALPQVKKIANLTISLPKRRIKIDYSSKYKFSAKTKFYFSDYVSLKDNLMRQFIRPSYST